MPTIADACEGKAANRASYQASGARVVEDELVSRCSFACNEVGCICDCAPLPVECDVERGVCVTREDDVCRCLCEPPDAGISVDAASP